MNQGKLKVLKQEMTKVNIHILGISELRWTGMDDDEWTWNISKQENSWQMNPAFHKQLLLIYQAAYRANSPHSLA